MVSNIKIELNSALFLKNPEESELGKKILSQGLEELSTLGFEKFTFKKLALKISSTEASIYRYFKDKHQFLAYLFNYYWAWLDFNYAWQCQNLNNSSQKIKLGIDILVDGTLQVKNTGMNMEQLHYLMHNEGTKVYMTKAVDTENILGYFIAYKQFISRLCNGILEINAQYAYANMLVSTVVVGISQQYFYSLHLPKLTSITPTESNKLKNFFYHLIINTIAK